MERRRRNRPHKGANMDESTVRVRLSLGLFSSHCLLRLGSIETMEIDWIDGVALLPFLLSRSCCRRRFTSLVSSSSSKKEAFVASLWKSDQPQANANSLRCHRCGRITDDFIPRLHGRTRGAGVGGGAFLSHEAETKAEIGV
jgi:DNA-directed RNA polymerase subunit N (RpoN/RPB10)